jgi:hypothetical protein
MYTQAHEYIKCASSAPRRPITHWRKGRGARTSENHRSEYGENLGQRSVTFTPSSLYGEYSSSTCESPVEAGMDTTVRADAVWQVQRYFCFRRQRQL